MPNKTFFLTIIEIVIFLALLISAINLFYGNKKIVEKARKTRRKGKTETSEKHRCTRCGMVFNTGTALGGHRSHCKRRRFHG